MKALSTVHSGSLMPGEVEVVDFDQILEIIQKNRGRAAGIGLGLVFGWFAITYGILKAVFVSLCIFAGYYIGRQIDSRSNWRDFFTGRFKDK